MCAFLLKTHFFYKSVLQIGGLYYIIITSYNFTDKIYYLRLVRFNTCVNPRVFGFCYNMKMNLREKFVARKIKKPNAFLSSVVFFFLDRISKKKKVEYHYGYDVNSLKNKPSVLLATHASRLEFVYAINGFKEKNINVVCGYQNVMQKYVYGLLKRLGVIAKFLYQPDFSCTKSMFSVLKRGGNLALFPEGIQSVSGSTHPINPATSKFLKRSGATIVLCKSQGAYLCRNRFSDDEKKGKIDMFYDVLFTPEDLRTMSEEEIYKKLLDKFKYNEFKQNKHRREKYVGKRSNSDGLDNIIYKCPNCGKEFSFKIEKSAMTCLDCGYSVGVDEYYDLTALSPHKLYYDNIDDWFKWQRACVKKEVAGEFLSLSAMGRLYKLRTDKLLKHPANKILLCEGTVTLDKQGLHLFGKGFPDEDTAIRRPADRSAFIEKRYDFDAREVYSMTFSLAGFWEFYYENEYYVVYPDIPVNQLVKWTVYSEEIHNLYDKKWDEASSDVYDEVPRTTPIN